MKVNMYWIGKDERDDFSNITKNFVKMSSAFANVNDHAIFNKKIAKAQQQGLGESQKEYSSAFEPKLSGFNVILDPSAKSLDTDGFAKLFEHRSEINFFIGGAYGFCDSFKTRGHKVIGLSPLTMSHKVARVVLWEQIYRALTILNNHPYHK